MNCKEVKENYDEYALTTVKGSVNTDIGEHLRSCKDCLSYFRDSEKLSILMEYWDSIEPESDFVTDFWNKVDDDKYNEKNSILEFIKGFRKTVLIPSVIALLICSVLIINIHQSVNYRPTFTEEDVKDEEFLDEIEHIITGDNYETLKVYGIWSDLDKEGMEG